MGKSIGVGWLCGSLLNAGHWLATPIRQVATVASRREQGDAEGALGVLRAASAAG